MKLLDPYQENELRLAQFNRLINELLRGNLTRNTFQPWEIELLLDIDTCDLSNGSRKEILRRYQKAVTRSMERGAAWPMKLSEYMGGLRARRAEEVEPRASVA